MARALTAFDLPINPARPLVMHVDMNSCFATIEQQANPLLRGRPVAVSPYTTPRGIIIAPSVEAKQLGVRLGMRNSEARQICPDIIILPPDPPKYRDAHQRFKRIFLSFTDAVAPKSIDEAVIDFAGSPILRQKSIEGVALEIKQRIRREIGEWVRVSVGIGTNRFLAKVAAGLRKPDGLEVIDESNLRAVYQRLALTDLPGINVRYEARLNSHGILTPQQFFAAPMTTLKRTVFRSIVGYYWYLRLRGWEIDDVDFARRSIGHTYALGQKTADRQELAKLIMKLCEKVGRRLRSNNYYASAMHLALLYQDRSYWHKSYKTHQRLYATQDIFYLAMRLLNMQPDNKVVSNLAVSVYELGPYQPQQLGLFSILHGDQESLARALDAINDRYGEFVITPALMMAMQDSVVDRIAFGGVKDIQRLYEEA